MTDAQIAMIVARLDRIEKRVNKLAGDAVTWKTLLLVVSTMAVLITAIVTAGNQLWA